MFGMSLNVFKRSVCILTIIIFSLTSLVGFSHQAEADQAELTMPEFQKGICYATWTKDRFESKYSEQSLEMLKEMGVEYLQINVTQFQNKFNSTEIFSTECTPSDKSVKFVIRKAHKLGLKVMLKPHLDLISTEEGFWRADIGFYDQESWEKWFKSYNKFILHYAKMAQKNKVQIFCVGTELSFTTQQTGLWRNLINEVKDKFDGELIYAANWDNYSNVEFWDELNYVGIDAYFPLTYKSEPTLEDIKEGWRKWVYEIETWQATVQKPIIFTEIGYPSSKHAPSEPWKNGAGNADVSIQAKCYAAFFDVVWNQPWLAGVYWWAWAPTIFGGGKNNRHFTPLKKPAAELIESNYKTARSGLGVDRDFLKEEGLRVIEQKPIYPHKVLNEIVGEYGRGMLPMAGANLEALNIGTLQPVLKTQQNPQFQQDWKNKHMTECMN